MAKITKLRAAAIGIILLFIASVSFIIKTEDYGKLSIAIPLFIFFMMSIRQLKKTPSYSAFNNRVTLFWYICVFFTLLLVIRLFNIQVLNNERYATRAIGQANKANIILGSRGKVYDSQNRVLAYDEPLYDLIINPKTISKNEKLMNAVVGIRNVYDDFLIVPSKKNLIKLSQAKRGSGYKIIARNISEESRNNIMKHFTDEKIFVGSAIEFKRKTTRIYNESSLKDSIGLVAQNKNSGGKRVGVSGIERFYENYLTERSIRRNNLFTNAKKMALPTSADRMEVSANGRDVYLTVDSFLQYILNEEVKKQYEDTKSEEAIGLIMDPQTGKILAVSTFERNEKTLRNPIIQNQYEPGSTFKPIVIGAALEEGFIKTSDTFDVGDGTIKKYNHTIRESSRHTRGVITLSQVLEKSSNVGMTLIGDEIPSSIFEKYLRDFGFGSRTGVDLPGEISPYLQESRRWNGLKKYTMAFGQGIATTPLQLITAFSAVINGGTLYEPYIVDKITDEHGIVIRRNLPEIKKDNIVSEKVSAQVREMLGNVVANGAVRAQVEGFEVGGKTGTAQISGPGGYIANQYLTSFIGFFPLDKPKYVILTMFSKPKVGRYEQYGGVIAAPVFSKVANRIINYKSLTSHEATLLKEQTYTKKVDEYTTVMEMPNLVGKSLRESMKILSGVDIKVQVTGTGVVKKQFPAKKTSFKGIKEIKLYLE